MNRDRLARAAGWFLSVFVVLCLFSPATAQDAGANLLPTPAGEIVNPALPLPLPIAQGARWLRYSLLAPLQPQSAQQSAPKQEEVSPEVRELEGVMQNRIGSVLRGTIFDGGNPAHDQAEQRRILAELERQHLAKERGNTKRVSDDGETETLPENMHWLTPADPLQAAAEHLRASARNLDLVAADLEDAGKYKEADRLRSRAQQMRSDARGFSQPPESAVTR